MTSTMQMRPTILGPRRGPRWLRALMASLLALGLMIGFLPQTAVAATVKELKGEWAAPVPATVHTGDLVNAVWYFNVNDDGAAPTNLPVDNVTATFQVTNGRFDALPEACLTEGVDPASSISADGKTMVCNIGTQIQGSAIRVTTPLVVTGSYPDEVSAKGSINEGVWVDLAPIKINNPFFMDIVWGAPARPDAYSDSPSNRRDFNFQWTLFHGIDSKPGPSTVTYDLTVVSSVAGAWGANPTCQPFSSGIASGRPWSGGTHPADQMAPFPGCTITLVSDSGGTATYRMTLTGIDYSHTQVPTLDSKGDLLPLSKVAIASGEILISQTQAQTGGNLSLTSSAPTYTAADDATAADDPANNKAAESWAFGVVYNSWNYPFTGQNPPAWTNQYLVEVTDTVRTWSGFTLENMIDPQGYQAAGLCEILDTKYVTFSDAYALVFDKRADWPPAGSEEDVYVPVSEAAPGTQMWYYTGTDALLDPSSTSYDPNEWKGCGSTTGWTTTLPTDLSTVRAVKVEFPMTDAIKLGQPSLYVEKTIKPTTPVGTDIWEWMASGLSSNNGIVEASEWNYPSRGTTPVPESSPFYGLRYPSASVGRDVLRTAASKPLITKTADPAVVLPYGTTTYTITYAAEGDPAVGPRDNYKVVDTLPWYVTYVEGSASPAPTTVDTTNPKQTVLTWEFDAVPLNTTGVITFRATLPNANPGSSYTNKAVATVDGISATASATVRVPSTGITRVAKTSAEEQIPNVGGTGSGQSSWTVTVSSADPRWQPFTDTIDILPYNGDERGTDMTGAYTLSGPVTAPAGARIYYTTAGPATIKPDPADPSNGSAGSVTGNTVGWTTTYTANATAVRVIGSYLKPTTSFSFTVPYKTTGMETGDLLVNTVEARAGETKLVMRTSADVSVAQFYAMSLKKYVLKAVDADPALDSSWADADNDAEYPRYNPGDQVQYKVCVTNTGTGDLTNIQVTDDLQPTKGAFTIPTLAAGANGAVGEKECKTYTVTLPNDAASMVVNTATATTTTPDNPETYPLTSDNPAGIYVTNQKVTVEKASDPTDGAEVLPGSTVTYTISFNNSGDKESYINYVDHLGDVVDDAVVDAASFTSSGDVAGALAEDGKSISISGYVPAGETVTFSYTVTVKALDSLVNHALVNFVRPPGVTPPAECLPDDPLCTVHPVPYPIHVEKQGLNCDVGLDTCPLNGAEFALYSTDPTAAGATPIANGITADAPGGATFTSVALATGTYWLVETKAPSGFNLLATPITFTYSTSGISLDPASGSVALKDADNFTIVVSDTTAAPLPKAGGDGPGGNLVLALLMLSGGVVISRMPSYRSQTTRTVAPRRALT